VDHDGAIARALNNAGHTPGREALHHELTSEIDRSLAHRAAPSRMFCEILRLRYRPSCGLAKYSPLRTITLPRRIVTIGQAKMSWPARGVSSGSCRSAARTLPRRVGSRIVMSASLLGAIAPFLG